MKILALEFSSSRRSVAVTVGGSVRGYAELERDRSTPALGLVEAALNSAEVQREEIGCVAVGLGPGSYTGIRMALALAQGFAMRGPVGGVGVSSVLALSQEAPRLGLSGVFHVVVDAQRGEFYLGDFKVIAGSVLEINPLQIVGGEEVRRLIRAGGQVVGPDLAPTMPGATSLCPDARVVARLASTMELNAGIETLKPIYLRQTGFVRSKKC